MAVSTFGNNIIEAFTGGVPVTAIYMGNTQVWPTSMPDPGEYYIEWWPRSLSGSFTIGGEARWMQDYNGYYNGPFLSEVVYTDSGAVRMMAIDSYAFKSTGILGVRTNVPFIGTQAFMNCESLAYVSMPGRYIKAGAFRGCTRLTDITLPSLLTLNGHVFADCSNLRNVELPNVVTIYNTLSVQSPFENCIGLQDVYLPKCKYIDWEVFLNCKTLPSVELPKVSIIGQNTFSGCRQLSCITIGYSGVCSGLGLTSSQYNVSIFVPLEWVSEYKSTYSGRARQFFPIPS